MAFEVKHILKEVGDQRNDPDYLRWAKDKVTTDINAAVHYITQARPDARLDDDGALRDIEDVSDENDTIPLADKWREVVVSYCLWKGYHDHSEARKHENSAKLHWAGLEHMLSTI